MKTLPKTPLPNEDATGAINKAALVAHKGTQNQPSCLFTLCFTIPVTPLIDTRESFSDSMTLIISSIFSLEMNIVNPFPSLTAPFNIFFFNILSKLSITDEVALVVNYGKMFSVKETTKSNSDFLSNFATILPIILTIILPK